MNYKCIIVDDEPPAIALIKKHLSLFDNFIIVGEYQSAVKAFEIIKKEKIDLIFLDIQMPVMTGVDFLKSLQNPPKVIFTTAYREYALEGYDLDIVDYLLKPISFTRFFKAIERFTQLVSNIKITSRVENKFDEKDFIYVNINKKNHKIVLENVLYIESLKDYVRIHTSEKKLVVKSNIGQIYTKLPKNSFLRVHRSFIVNITKITAFTAHDIEIENIEIPIGSSYKSDVRSKLNV